MFKITKQPDCYTLYITLSTAKDLYLFNKATERNDDFTSNYDVFLEKSDMRFDKFYYHVACDDTVTVIITFWKLGYVESSFNFNNKDVTKFKKYIQKAMNTKAFG